MTTLILERKIIGFRCLGSKGQILTRSIVMKIKLIQRKAQKSSRHELGAALVETGLLVVMIALLAINRVEQLGWSNYVRSCQAGVAFNSVDPLNLTPAIWDSWAKTQKGATAGGHGISIDLRSLLKSYMNFYYNC